MKFIIDLLSANPVLLLFMVAAIGFPLGKLKFRGASLGVSAVLFVGLLFGALDPNIKLPEIIYKFGLVIFVYSIGLTSAPMFFDSLRKKGVSYNVLIVLCLVAAAGLSVGAHFLFGFSGSQTAGLFSGSLTNTPALAAVLEFLQGVVPANALELAQAEPVVAYSITYPVGVLGVILAIYFSQKLWKINYQQEARIHQLGGANFEQLANETILIKADFDENVQALIKKYRWNVIFGRHLSGEMLELSHKDTLLKQGDLLHVVASPEDLEKVLSVLGSVSEEHLNYDLRVYDKFRIFISSQKVAGKRLRDIAQFSSPDVMVTRIRRGDAEFLPHGDTKLYLGDQLQIVTKQTEIEAIRKVCGDSFKGISEFNVFTFGAGIVLGLLVGEIPIPLPGGIIFKLGIAGGPLLMAIVLGAIGRTGPLVWTIPYSANLVLRQIGLVLFLATVGTRSGYAFFETLLTGNGGYMFLAGICITCLTAMLALFIGYKLLHIPMGILTGVVAGMHTQPAVLAFALEQTESELPNVGYAMVYPVAMIMKILLAQTILISLTGLAV
jgi:putative transport protein